MTISTGARPGYYEIVSQLGAGGMGEVFRARDTRLGREVTIKVLPGELTEPERLRRFELEARSASALNHPSIITVYDIGTHEKGIRPPRPKARESLRHEGRTGQDPRLRPGQAHAP